MTIRRTLRLHPIVEEVYRQNIVVLGLEHRCRGGTQARSREKHVYFRSHVFGFEVVTNSYGTQKSKR